MVLESTITTIPDLINFKPNRTSPVYRTPSSMSLYIDLCLIYNSIDNEILLRIFLKVWWISSKEFDHEQNIAYWAINKKKDDVHAFIGLSPWVTILSSESSLDLLKS